MVETNEKLHVSDEHVIRLRVLIGQIVGVCRESLKAIMLEQVQCSEVKVDHLLLLIYVVVICLGIVKKFE